MSQEQNNNIVFIKEHENKLLNKNKIIKSKNHKSIVSNNVQIKKKFKKRKKKSTKKYK